MSSLRIWIGHSAVCAIGALAALWHTPAFAQMSANPPEVGATIRKMGPELTREMFSGTNQLYAPIHAKASTDGLKITTDIAYGTHERNKLDVIAPAAGASSPRPIVVFVHGGGFVAGDKSTAQNVGRSFARNGIVALVMNYRFAPHVTWPSGPEDVAAVIKWAKANASVHGGDPGSIFLVGNSAGAMHVAGYAFFPAYHVENDGVKGVIMISAPSLNLTDHALDPRRDELYFGKDISKYAERSVIKNLGGRKIPLLLAIAEFDIALAHQQNAQLMAALQARDGVLPNLVTALGHNHISIVEHLDTPDQDFSRQMLEFIRQEMIRQAQ